jgi:thymidylate synthase
VFSSDNIDNLLEQLWNTIYNKGTPLHFGDPEEPKDALEIFAIFQIYGKAIQRLYNGDTPKGWMFRNAANQEYVKMLKDPNKGDQPYTYGERLHNQRVTVTLAEQLSKKGFNVTVNVPKEDQAYTEVEVNQIEEHKKMLTDSIEYGIQSNRIWGDIGRSTDLKLKDPPCFRGWMLRLSERNKISLRIFMRSNDAGNAVFSNLCAFVRVFTDEVIVPAGGILEEVILVAASEHIYLHDFDQIEALVGKVPEHMKRFMK